MAGSEALRSASELEESEAGRSRGLELRDLDAAAAGAVHAVEVLQVAMAVDDAYDDGITVGTGCALGVGGHCSSSFGSDGDVGLVFGGAASDGAAINSEAIKSVTRLKFLFM